MTRTSIQITHSSKLGEISFLEKKILRDTTFGQLRSSLGYKSQLQ